MSTLSSPQRRRRIAGERRGAAAPERGGEPPVAPPTGQSRERRAPEAPRPDPATPSSDTPPRPVGWRTLLGLAVLAVVTVAVAAGPFVPGVGVQAIREASVAEATDATRRTAPAAAERAAAAILAYDHRRLETDRDAAARFMTPDYRRQYLRTFNGVVLDTAAEQKARVTAEVRASGVTLASADRAEVLLFVNQTTLSRAHPEPQVALNRVMLTMQRSGESWLVDDITSY